MRALHIVRLRHSLFETVGKLTGYYRQKRGPEIGREKAVKGNVKVVMSLNKVLTNELTAIDQYFVTRRSSSTGASIGSARSSARNRSTR